MDEGVQTTQAIDPQNNSAQLGDHPAPRRRPAGRKAGPAPENEAFGRHLRAILKHCFPELNNWLSALCDPRFQPMCTYTGRQLWWSAILTFLLRHGSRNGFDADRNRGQFPENLLALCGQSWEEDRLGSRRTVTCSENFRKHAARVPVGQVAQIPFNMARRLMNMRLLDEGRLLEHWWLVAVDGTLQDRGRATPSHLARYRYVVEAALAGPNGLMIPLATEFHDIYDPVRDRSPTSRLRKNVSPLSSMKAAAHAIASKRSSMSRRMAGSGWSTPLRE